MNPRPTMNPVRNNDLSVAQKYRAAGCIVGSAIGDAVGAPFEFQQAGTYGNRFPAPVIGGTGEMVGGGGFGWAPGEFTDDTQMAMALASSLVSLGKWDPSDVWTRFRAWGASARDVGITTRAALSRRDFAVAAEHAHTATGGRSASNGCVMRIAPVGVHGVTLGAAGTISLAAAQARLTHFDPAAAAGSAIVAEVIRRVILTGTFGQVAEEVTEELCEHSEFGPAARQFATIVGDGFDPHTFVGPGNGSVWTAVAQALWSVRTTASFHDAIVASVELGGDTDTVAAIAGAVAGALYGLQSIPVRWVTYVHGYLRNPDGSQSEFRSQELIDTSRRLIGDGPAYVTPPELPAGPLMVDPEGVFAANLEGAALAPRDHAVVSMCITEDRFLQHPHRRTVFMRDNEDPANPDLFFAVKDAVDSIDAFLKSGTSVVVHCHGGRSRTGLVLKAWYMKHHGVGHEKAHTWLAESWDLYEIYNESFLRFLDKTWTHHVATLGTAGKGPEAG